MNYRIELAGRWEEQTFERHDFLFPDDALECGQALARTYPGRVRIFQWMPAFSREADGTCVDESGWESMDLAELESDVAAM